MSTEEILIIGAGPFGLSISAHLRALGVDHRIVGRPMDTWRAHMPAGMQLRSEPYGSDMASPVPGFDVAAYCRLHGLDFVERLGPLSVERFLDYTQWYIDQLVPEVQDVTVTDVTATGDGFDVTFADAGPLAARQVVVATGILAYATVPDTLAGLAGDLVSHTADHHDLDRFAGRRVAVVGGGQSALETAALLHEAGADTQVVMRRPALTWLEPNPERLSRIGHLRRPVNKLCEGWHCTIWNSPAAFRLLPQAVRVTKARTVLGPAGAWWLKDRIEGVVEVLTDHRVRGVEPHGTGVRLLVEGPTRSTIDVDHVISGTGFRVDVSQLPFLSSPLVSAITRVQGYPVVNRAGESSVPGLYFAGAPAAASLGPSARFIAGTHNSARQLSRSVADRAGAGHRTPAAPAPSVPAAATGSAARVA